MERKRIGDLILSVVMALFLWSYVINVVNPPVSVTVRDVPVVLEGRETLRSNKLTIAGDGFYTVDVTVSAPRAEVTGVTAADLRAQADISALSAGQNYVEVKVSGPNNISIDNLSTSKIQVYVDELVTKDVPLKVAFVQPEDDTEITVLDAPETVSVTGAGNLAAMASEVRVDLDTQPLQLDVPHTQNLIPVCLDAEGNVLGALEIDSERIRVEAALYKTKSVPLKLNYVGTPGLGAQLRSSKIPSSVLVKGPTEKLDQLLSVKANTINIDGITQDTSYSISFLLPEGVYLSESAGSLKARFELVHVGEISFSYQADQILLNDEPDAEKFTYSFTPVDVSVYATGELDVIRKLEAKDLQPVADLAGLEPGVHTVPFTVLQPKDGITVTFSPANVIVSIEALPEEELPEPGSEE